MKTLAVLDVRVPGAAPRQFRIPIWISLSVLIALIGLPLLELAGQVLMEKPKIRPPPPLSEARKISGTLHFTRGARDWREAELTEGRAVTVLHCRRFRAADACFTLKQGEQYEGREAVVWWHPEAEVLQIQVGADTVVDYKDTVKRFTAPVSSSAPFLVGYFIVLSVIILGASRFVKLSLTRR